MRNGHNVARTHKVWQEECEIKAESCEQARNVFYPHFLALQEKLGILPGEAALAVTLMDSEYDFSLFPAWEFIQDAKRLGVRVLA